MPEFNWRWYKAENTDVPYVPPVPSQDGTERPALELSNPVVAEIARYFSHEVLPEVAALIEDFDLIPVSIQHLEPSENENPD
jgi:hypothetical protein